MLSSIPFTMSATSRIIVEGADLWCWLPGSVQCMLSILLNIKYCSFVIAPNLEHALEATF